MLKRRFVISMSRYPKICLIRSDLVMQKLGERQLWAVLTSKQEAFQKIIRMAQLSFLESRGNHDEVMVSL